MTDNTQTLQLPEVEERIVIAASELFFKYGYSKVTTDEIAERLGMSKKTLYKYFPSKEQLLASVFDKKRKELIDDIENILHSTELDLIDKIKIMLKTAAIQLSVFERTFIKDIKSKFPEIWEQLRQFESENIVKGCELLFEEGVKRGLFKKVFNKTLLVRFYFEAVRSVLTTNILEELPVSLSELFDSVLVVLFEGVLTDDGREKYLGNG